MKRIAAFGFLMLLILVMAGCSPSVPKTETEQKGEIETETSTTADTATENNTEEASDMRVRLTSEDFNEIEKICRLPEEIATEGVEMGTDPEETTQITLTAGETVITAELDNSETSREFLATLPCTMEMNRYDDREYYGRMEEISENGTAIESFENGDLTYYPAGPSLAVFFDKEDTSRQGGLIRMGKITSDLSAFETMGETEEILIAIAE